MSLLFPQQLLAVDPYGRRFPDLVARLEASSSFEGSAFLLSHPRLSAQDKQALAGLRPQAIEKGEKLGVRVVLARDLGLDWQSQGAPPFFFCRGALEDVEAPRVAIVGTRGASTYGKAAAMKFAEALASHGVVVVSGGALGIDSCSHQAALDAGGTTWAVLGTGADQLHPPSNAPLFGRILEGGAILSQYPLGMPSLPHHFVARNHTIAALASAVIVVEAPAKSGSLHTARAAAEMGREVFVVPGPITNPGFMGSHSLIRDGATLVDHPDQVLEALSIFALRPPPGPPPTGPAAAITSALQGGPRRLDELEDLTGLDSGSLLSELTMMEIEGLVQKGPEGYTIR